MGPLIRTSSRHCGLLTNNFLENLSWSVSCFSFVLRAVHVDEIFWICLMFQGNNCLGEKIMTDCSPTRNRTVIVTK